MIIKKNVIYARNEEGNLEPLENLLVGQQDTISADKVTDLAMVAKTGRYEHLIGAPDPDDLIVDAGIEVGDVEPERTSIDVWIDTNQGQTTYRIPEVKDNLINEQDTWSSARISKGDLGVNSSIAQMPMSAQWRSAAYGNGKYVVIEGADTGDGVVNAAYSDNGVIWTCTTMPAGRWQKVTYGNGIFVAIGLGSIAAYSEDGITWIETTLPKSALWSDVIYGNNRFVAIGSASYNGCSAYSINGKTWILGEEAFSNMNFSRIAYGNNKFVIVSDMLSGSCYGEDGITWTETSSGVGPNKGLVVFGNDKFVVLDHDAGAYYSKDGITWTRESYGYDATIASLTYGNGLFIAPVSDSSSNEINTSNAFYSYDGITWNITTLQIETIWKAVIYGDGKFIAISENGTDVALSKNGIAWDTKSPYLSQNEENVTSQVHEALNINKNYCLGEVKTGDTWIDGKPIYRFIWQGTTSLEGAQGVVCRLPEGHFDTVFTLRGMFKRTTDNNWFAIPNIYYGAIGWAVNIRTDISTNEPDGILLGFGEKYTDSNRPIIVIAEYTKS